MVRGLRPGREAAVRFWREEMQEAPREGWQEARWALAIGWYLAWAEAVLARGAIPRSLPELFWAPGSTLPLGLCASA